MLKIENVVLPSAEQMKAVIRGMRNPMNSLEKSDSEFGSEDCENFVHVGENDRELMRKLNVAGSAHSKYKRMMWVYCDIVAPMYWWKELDTYLHTVRNSCSTMHKIQAKEFTLEDFSCEHLVSECICFDMTFGEQTIQLFASTMDGLKVIIGLLNANREVYLKTNDKKYWWQMIQLLPSSYNQRSTVMMNYETLTAMYRWRRTHKLDEWQTFCDWIETLPYSELITGGEND